MRLFRNDVTEVERLYRDHGSALVLFATSITGKRDQAPDAVHQVFLKLIEGRKHERVSDAASSTEHCHAYQEPEGRFRIQHLDRASAGV